MQPSHWTGQQSGGRKRKDKKVYTNGYNELNCILKNEQHPNNLNLLSRKEYCNSEYKQFSYKGKLGITEKLRNAALIARETT